jgi:hypothetical protein
MQPITTVYRGYRFRSRLEARWAVFFDALGLNWTYEPEGFDLDGDWYLPDFRVTSGEITYWYEIKPLNSEPCEKFDRFTELIATKSVEGDEGVERWRISNIETRLVLGDPFDVFMGKDVCPRCGKPENLDRFSGNEVGFLCHPCDDVTACHGGNPPEIGFTGVEFWPHKGWILITESNYQLLQEKLQNACKAARGARFEHGEQG